MTDLVFPVYEFRPLPHIFKGPFRRYAEGRWAPDDGEYDLAFIPAAEGWPSPICLMVELPYQRNIVWGWMDGHWTENNYRHPRANPWHYALREGETEWGGLWVGRDRHPNRVAGDAGMAKVCGERRSASGVHVEFKRHDPHIAAGLVRDRETKAILTVPYGAKCMYCGDALNPPPQSDSAEGK